jgi:hypothetical protein
MSDRMTARGDLQGLFRTSALGEGARTAQGSCVRLGSEDVD